MVRIRNFSLKSVNEKPDSNQTKKFLIQIRIEAGAVQLETYPNEKYSNANSKCKKINPYFNTIMEKPSKIISTISILSVYSQNMSEYTFIIIQIYYSISLHLKNIQDLLLKKWINPNQTQVLLLHQLQSPFPPPRIPLFQI